MRLFEKNFSQFKALQTENIFLKIFIYWKFWKLHAVLFLMTEWWENQTVYFVITVGLQR